MDAGKCTKTEVDVVGPLRISCISSVEVNTGVGGECFVGWMLF
jgi:hypothetical protein